MNKSDQTATRTNARGLVDDPCPLVLQFIKRGLDVRYLDCNMVHPWAAFREKLADSRIRTQRFKQLDVSVANRQHAYFHALFGDFLGCIDLQPKRVAPYSQTFFDAFGRYSDVINF